MTQFSMYLSKLHKSPLTEAVRALYESAMNSSTDEMFSTLASYVKWCLTENWIHTVSNVRKYGTFMFQCNLRGISPTLHVNFTLDTPMFAEDPDVIEIVANDPILVQCYMKEVNGEDTASMQQDVTDAIMKLLNDRKDYITSRLHEMSAEDIAGQSSMEPTTLLWKLDDILSNYYTPDYKQMPFTKFAKQYLEKPTEDALKELAEMIQFHGGTVTTEDRPHSGGSFQFNPYKKLAKLADDKKLTTAQVINYLTGVYSIGNYLGCSGILQLNNGMIYSDGYVYGRDTVINALKSLYDSTFYEDAVEEWNDHDYKRESLMHELRGNRYPLLRQHRVHRLKNGEAPEYRTWVSTADQSTGNRPIDTVLDQLKTSGNAKHVKPNKNLDWLISQSGKLPSVESSRKRAKAVYESVEDTALTPFDDSIDIAKDSYDRSGGMDYDPEEGEDEESKYTVVKDTVDCIYGEMDAQLKSKGTVTVYRALSAKEAKDIRMDYLGEAWSLYEDTAIEFGSHNGSNFILKAEAGLDAIDLNRTWEVAGACADLDEYEVCIEDTDRLRDLQIGRIVKRTAVYDIK